jgi:Na+/H+ antiporter NhaD/arsenite permease-like protein
MLHQEWSTLGLLFGMMVIVGELSHTGIFEWLAVRLLLKSNSFNRLMVLLCLLTAVASAFLDNVTTMLLIAPVTIDMCGILSVDPRPYLIAEILLSNVGGTATLIGKLLQKTTRLVRISDHPPLTQFFFFRRSTKHHYWKFL